MKSGYLSLHMGTMRADKSCIATRRATKYADLGEKVLYVCSSLDKGRETEGGNGTDFTSHSSSNRFLSEKVDRVSCSLLGGLEVGPYDRIVIDEGQFFEDIVENVLRWVDQENKIVHIAGLDSSYKRTKIGHLLELIPHADYYEKFTAKCVKCLEGPERRYQDAIFTMLERNELDVSESDCKQSSPRAISDCKSNGDVIKPGNQGYAPVCRYHYNLCNQ